MSLSVKQISDYSIRIMSEDDLPAVHEIEKDSFPDPWPKSFFKQELSSGRSKYFIMEYKGIIAGYAGYTACENEAEILNFAVHRDLRRKGLGNVLLAFIVNTALEGGAKKIFLEVRRKNKAAVSLYNKHGFEQSYIRKNYYQKESEDAVVMVFK